MTSTYLTYRLLAKDFTKSLARVASQAQVARDVAYYQSNIGKVTSVDGFLKDQRLYTFAMKAAGLDDMIFAKAFMKKVLQSDLSDPDSFANKLSDPRFKAFAQDYNFNATGGVKETLTYAQEQSQESDTVDLYSQARATRGTTAAADAAYYASQIGAVDSVDDLIGNSRLFSFALTAYGIDSDLASKDFIRNVLTSDLGDPGSLANTLANPKYLKLAQAFGFNTDGSVTPGNSAQTDAQRDTTIYLHYQQAGASASPAYATFETANFQSKLAGITSVDDLLNDDRLRTYALTAFSLDPFTSKTTIRQALTSDLSDPGSFANTQSDPHLAQLAAAFNFDTDGGVTNPDGAQSAAQNANMVARYKITFDDAAEAADAAKTSYYAGKIFSISSVDELVNNSTLFDYVVTAFGFDSDKVTPQSIRAALTSDLSDVNSYANRQSDVRYRTLAAAFNFGADGKALQPRKAQTDADELTTIRLYGTTVGTSDSESAAAKTEGAYYHNAIIGVRSVTDFLADKRLVKYALQAFGFAADERITNDTLRKVLTSDPLDPNSYANKQTSDPRLRKLAAAFNFTADGNAGRVAAKAVQSRSEIVSVTDAYLRQTMENDAGQDNEGVRLALYFERKAPDITSAYGILADKALLKFVQTALNLPTQMSQADLDAQARMITKRLNIADLKDPAKLEKLLARFGAMYDIDNVTTNGVSSPALTLLTGGDDTGTDQNLLLSMQRMRF